MTAEWEVYARIEVRKNGKSVYTRQAIIPMENRKEAEVLARTINAASYERTAVNGEVAR